MSRKLLLPLLALAGVAVTVAAVLTGGPPPPTSPSSTAPTPSATPAAAAPAGGAGAAATPPYASYVAGAGLVEASTGNIAVGSPVSGIVSAVDVAWGDHVEVGDPLFKIDDRDLQAELPTARARVAEAEATLAEAEYLLGNAERLHREGIATDEELARRRFTAESGRAALATRQAEVRQIEAEIDRRTVRARVAGRILQINARPGQFADSAPGGPPLMVLGGDARLDVRVDVDEDDAWRIHPGARARAYVRGNPALSTDLRFERVEPLLVPKTALTGAGTERTDTRVLQVVFSFDPTALPVHVGQQVDVFIEAPPA